MSTRTTYYNLTKPDADEHVLRTVINQNYDAIDLQMHANAQAAQEAAQNAADAYDDTASYTAGEFAIYQNVLYKATAATSGAFDPTKWEQTSIAAEFEKKPKWELFETITADGNEKRYDRTLSEKISGLFIIFEVEAATAQDNIQIYAWFLNETGAKRAGYILGGINTAARYSNMRYTRDGNLWLSEQGSASGSSTGATTLGRQVNGYFLTSEDMERFRIDTDSLNFPSGSKINIYVRK